MPSSELFPIFLILKQKKRIPLKLPVTAIILTFNEEKNIRACIESIFQYVDEIIVVDSGSTDATYSYVMQYQQVHWVKHPFVNYAEQRNWCLQHLNIRNEWVLNMDADHRATPQLIQQLQSIFANPVMLQSINGFLVSRKTFFMGKWIRFGGHYPVYHAVMFRKNKGYCEHKKYDQHFVVEGNTKILSGDMIDVITDSLTNFTARHNRWSSLEAEYIFTQIKSEKEINPSPVGNPIEQRRYYRNLYYKAPLFLRVFLYFFYRYFLKLGFLDGLQGLIFHFLQGFWFRFLVDAKIYELQRKNENM